MNTSRLMAGASRFAHLAGFARPSRRASEDDDKQGRRAADDDDDQADDDDAPKGKRGRRAAEDDDDKQGRRAADDDDQAGDDDDDIAGEDDDDAPKGKRGRRAADDDDADDEQPKGKRGRRAAEDDDDKGAEDDDEDEMKGKGANASARRREQARIAHILGHKAAASNLPLAVSLACDTRMTRHEAVAVLRGQANGDSDRDDAPRNRHARRDRQDRNPALGSDREAPRGQQAVSASWDRAFASAGVAPTPKG